MDVRSNAVPLQINDHNREINIAQGLHLLKKASRKNLGISWSLRITLIAGLTTAAGLSLRDAFTNTDSRQWGNNPSDFLLLQNTAYQNQTKLLSTYDHTHFVSDETCAQALPVTINTMRQDFNNETFYSTTSLAFPHLHSAVAPANCTSTLENLCQNKSWPFYIPNHHFHHLHASFNQSCCPILYKMCSNIGIFPMPSPMPMPQQKNITSLVGGSIALLALLLEVLNAFITEQRQSISSPRLFFFPLYKQFSLLSKNDERIVRNIASQYGITIVENNLQRTVANFEAAIPTQGNRHRPRI